MQEPNYKNTVRKQLYKKKLRIKYITLFLVLLVCTGPRQNLPRDLSLKDSYYKSASVSERYVFVGTCDRGSASAHLRYVNKSYTFRQSLCNFCRNAQTVCNKWTLYVT